MTNPYTTYPLDAFMAAETSLAAALTAVLLFRREWRLSARALLFAAIVVAVGAPSVGDLVRGIGYEWLSPRYLILLEVSAALGSLAIVASQRTLLIGPALVGEFALYRAAHYFTDQDLALSALHVAWLGALIGLLLLTEDPPAEPAREYLDRRFPFDDVVLASLAVVLAGAVSTFVLKHHCDSADEWAYTFQASVFAKLHAYSVKPPCYEAFRAFWVFEKGGHVFSQYLPGWPLFMAPFFAVGAVWLAGPFALAVLVLGIVRLGRRASSATIDAQSPRAELQVRAAGLVSGAVILLSDTMLINGGSRFPHIWLCAMFVWSMEGICRITSPLSQRDQTRWGMLLGCSLAWLLATRHVDGCLLGAGMFSYVLYAFVRGRLTVRAAVATAVPFAFFGGITLVLLRLQLGAWFTTGYSLTDIIHPWNKMVQSWPRPNEWRWGFPIDAGAYCWAPMAPAIGIAGLLALGRTRERRLSFMMGLGTTLTLVFYASLEYSRGWDFGYGPRYQLVVIVPMAVGAGVLFAPLAAAALTSVADRPAFEAGGPAMLAAAAAVLAAIRIAPLVYPANTEDIKERNVVFDAVARDHISNALVWVSKGQTISDPLDLAQNLPPDLYAPPPAYVLRDVSPEMRKCVQGLYPDRRSYHPQGGRDAHLVAE